MDAAADTRRERLDLAEWRRRVADLYADVRRLSATDPAAAHARWQGVRETLYRDHDSSPVPPERRGDFRALHFPYDANLRFELAVLADVGPAAGVSSPVPDVAPPALTPVGLLGLKLPISTGQPLAFERIGWLEVPFASGSCRLALFWLPEYSGGLFLPFRDQTNGRQTYGGGRYLLDTAKGADLGGDARRNTIVVDFNFAYQPSCAFDPRWSCPLSPPENTLDIEIRAGERIG